MEPLDKELAARLAKIKATYREKPEGKYTTLIQEPPFKKKIAKVYSEGSAENKLQDYVARSRAGREFIKMKIDNADYSLTKHILEVIERACLCPIDELRNNKRDSGLTIARAIFVFLERKLNKRSYPEVAAILNKDHTSCIHMRDNFRNYKDTKIFQVYLRDPELRELYYSAIKGDFQWPIKESQ